MELLNVNKKKRTIECDKNMVICYIGTTQCDDRTIKYEKKNQDSTECDKSTIKSDVGTSQCKN